MDRHLMRLIAWIGAGRRPSVILCLVCGLLLIGAFGSAMAQDRPKEPLPVDILTPTPEGQEAATDETGAVVIEAATPDGRAFPMEPTLQPMPTPLGGGSTPEKWLANYCVGAGGWTNYDIYPRMMGDVNGDGKADIVGFGRKGVYIALSNGSGFGAPTIWIANFGTAAGLWTNYNTFPRCMGDVNGDGKADVVGFGKKGVYVALSNGSKFLSPSLWVANFGAEAGGWTSQDLYPRALGDVNGDGKADVVGFGNRNIYVALSDGAKFANPMPWASGFGVSAGGWTSQDRYPRMMADVNGDGKADVVGFGQKRVYVATSTGSAFGATEGWTVNNGDYTVIRGWEYQDKYPRTLAKTGLDAKMDVVGFGDEGVYASDAKDPGPGFMDTPEFVIANYAYHAGGWTSFYLYPRFMADVDGNGIADIIGFGHKFVYVSLY